MIVSPSHLAEEESYNFPDLFHRLLVCRLRAVLLLDSAQVRRIEETVSEEVHGYLSNSRVISETGHRSRRLGNLIGLTLR